MLINVYGLGETKFPHVTSKLIVTFVEIVNRDISFVVVFIYFSLVANIVFRIYLFITLTLIQNRKSIYIYKDISLVCVTTGTYQRANARVIIIV